MHFHTLFDKEMDNVNGRLKFQNHYGRVHVHLNGNCKVWRADAKCKESKDGGWFSTYVCFHNLSPKLLRETSRDRARILIILLTYKEQLIT